MSDFQPISAQQFDTLIATSDSIESLLTSVDNRLAAGLSTIITFPDNEPLNISQLGGVAVGANNPFYVKPGGDAVFNIGTMPTVAVTGTFWQATQPVSIADTVAISAVSLPLPTGAATAARQDTGNTSLSTIAGAVSGSEMQVDVLTMPTVAVTIAQDVMLGTDFSDVFGTALLILTAGADNLVNTQDTIATSSLLYAFDGTTWDRMLGNSTDGLLVNLGTNNDVTVTGTVAVSTAFLLDATFTGVFGSASLVITTQADNLVNTQDTIATSALLYAFDGATWDRMLGNSTDGLLVNLGTNNDVTVTSGAITETNSNAIKTAVELIDNAISGSEMQVDVVAALPAGTNALGKLLPPDIDVVTHTNYAKKYYTNAGAVTDGIIWSPAAGKRWHVTTLYIQVSAASTITLEDDLAGGDSAVWKGEIAANSGVVIPFGEKYPLASGEDAADLIITTSAGNVYVTAVGYEI